MLGPLPNHGTLLMPNGDDDDDYYYIFGESINTTRCSGIRLLLTRWMNAPRICIGCRLEKMNQDKLCSQMTACCLKEI